jgi:PAS domain S-box-containing protein
MTYPKEGILQASEQKYKTLIDNIVDVVFETLMDGTILYLSPSFEQLFGLKTEDFIGVNFMTFVYPEDLPFIVDVFANNKFSEHKYIEYRLQSPEVGIKWIQTSARTEHDENGKPIKRIGLLRDITELRNTEEKLRLSEERFKSMLSRISDVVYEVDLLGNIVYVSPSVERVLGYTPEEVLGRNIFQFIAKEDIAFVQNLLETVDRRVEKFTEYRYLAKDGSIRWVRSSTTPKYENGALVGGTGTLNDITEKKLAEVELIKFSQAVDQSPVSIVITKLDGSIEYANPKACETTGYSLAELKGKNPRVLKSGETPPKEYQQLWNAITSGSLWRGVFHNKRKNGEYYWESSQIAPIQDLEGNTTHYMAIKEDITDRILIQENLIGSERRFREIAEQSQNVIWEVDTEGLYTYVSPAASAVWGYEPEELVGKAHFYDLHPENGREAFKKAAMAVFKEKEFFNRLENPLVTKDKRNIWVLTNGAPILDTQGSLVGYRGSDIDISAVKLSAESLRESEQRYRSIFNNSKSVMLIIDPITGQIIDANKSASAFYGWSQEELCGKRISDINRSDSKTVQDSMQRTFAGNQQHFRFKHLLKDGTIRDVEVFSGPVEYGDKTLLFSIVHDITDRRMAEEALMSSEKDLSYSQEIAEMGSWQLNLVTNEFRWSDNLKRMLGFKHVGQSFNYARILAKVSSKDHAVIRENMDRIRRNKRNASFEVRFELDDQHVIWLQVNIHPQFENDKLVYLNGVSIDITNKTIREMAHKQMSMAVEQSPVITVVTDLNACIVYANPAFEHVTGYTLEEVMGKNVRILNSGMTDSALYKDLWLSIRANKTWHGEWINKKKSGELYWEEVQISPIFDEQGTTINYLAVKSDISQRKKAEEEIRELNSRLEHKVEERTIQLAQSEEKYRSVVENVLEIIFITDLQGHWLFLNKAWEEITGFDTEESIGKSLFEFVHPEDRAQNVELFRQLTDLEKPYCRHEIRYLTKSGGFRWIEAFASLRLNDDGEPTGSYGTLKDITERKLNEEFELVLLELAPKLAEVQLDRIEAAINLALSRIGNFLGADRAYIYELDETEPTMDNTYEWCNTGVESYLSVSKKISTDLVPNWLEQVRRKSNIQIPSVDDLPENWGIERSHLQSMHVKSLICIPIFTEQTLTGFVGLDSIKEKRSYSASEINMLMVWSSMLSGLIGNRRTEILLEQTRQNYQTFFNSVEEFLIVLDEEGRVVHANDTLYRRLGYTTDEMVCKTVLDLRPEERRLEASDVFIRVLKGETNFCAIPYISKNGEHIPVETHINKGIWDGKSRYFCVSKDISKIKLSEEKFASAFHSNSALMAISSPEDGKFLDVNETFLTMLGFEREEVIGRNSSELSIFQNADSAERIQEQFISEGMINELEFELRTKMGESKTGLLSAKSIYIGDQRCMLTVVIDITERKKAESLLQEARMAADVANKAKSEFLSRMSHELRTPMNSILGFAQLLELGELNPGQKKGVNHILKSGKHLLDLINEVLDISRIESGRLSLSIEAVQIKPMVLEMIDIIKPQAEERAIRIELIETSDIIQFVHADRQRLKQILLNLLNNAVKYNRERGTIRIQAMTERKGMVRISVSDTGLGIPAEFLPKLFTPFERIGADKTNTEGTGLGLSVVKKIIEVMDGHYGVESEPGVGSTFWVELPLSESPEFNAFHSSIPTSNHSLQTAQKGIILYVEDNRSNIELMEQILQKERAEYVLITEMLGSAVLERVLSDKPNLILLDLNLPDMHGHEVLEKLKSDRRTNNIPVVVISADAMPQQLSTMLKAGADDYLTKPLELPVLIRTIDKYLQL